MKFEALKDLEGRVAVITGGTGQIGLASGRALASLGARVVALARRDLPEAQVKMQELPNAERLAHFALPVRITDSESLRIAAEEVKARAGRCDILINAAAINSGWTTKLDDLTDEIFDEILTTNLRGTFAAIRAFSPMLKATGDGLIVNLSSVAGLHASRSNIAYSASKAGVNLMTLSLAKALAPDIRVVAIAPGRLPKPASGAYTADENLKALGAALAPLKRLTQPEDVASAVAAFATTMRFANGTILAIDGGRSIC